MSEAHATLRVMHCRTLLAIFTLHAEDRRLVVHLDHLRDAVEERRDTDGTVTKYVIVCPRCGMQRQRRHDWVLNSLKNVYSENSDRLPSVHRGRSAVRRINLNDM